MYDLVFFLSENVDQKHARTRNEEGLDESILSN